VSQLGRARKAKEAAPKEKSKGATGKASEPDPKKAKMEGAELMEHAPTFARQFKNIPSKDALEKLLAADASSIDQPILISKAATAEQLEKMLKHESCVGKELDVAANTLLATVKKLGTPVRGAYDMSLTSATPAVEFLKEIFPSDLTVDDKLPPFLRSALMPQIFVSSTHPKVYSQAERGHLATLRWQHHGTRFMVVTAEAPLLAFMRSRSPGSHPTFTQVWQFWKSLSSDLLKAYAETHGKNLIWSSTIAPGDVAYLPPCFVAADRVMNDIVVGIKLSIVLKSHKDSLESVFLELEARKRADNPSAELVKTAVMFAKGEFTQAHVPLMAIVEGQPAAAAEAKAAGAIQDASVVQDKKDAEAAAAALVADRLAGKKDDEVQHVDA
jgi:hypothetical protein